MNSGCFTAEFVNLEDWPIECHSCFDAGCIWTNSKYTDKVPPTSTGLRSPDEGIGVIYVGIYVSLGGSCKNNLYIALPLYLELLSLELLDIQIIIITIDHSS
jgi:hypothetical protein